MKAITQQKYGPPEVLELKEIPKPVPKENEVLVKVHAAALNAADWHLMRGTPFLMRLMFGGLTKPKYIVPGADMAGTVESVGSSIKQFKPGDEVFGDISVSSWGAFAEYVSVHEKALVIKPAGLTFEEAAAVPLASVTALQALRDAGKIGPGQKVLINGASGGVGTYAIQIAKAFGAVVTAVCSTHNVEQARALGAERVFDYKKEDITRDNGRFDLILDCAAFRPVSEYKRILNPGGNYVLVGGSTGNAMKLMFMGSLISLGGKRKFSSMMAKPNAKDLGFIKDLIGNGSVKPVIDRVYPLHELPEAFRYLEEGHAKGKIVISIK
jgi:NADPH:quinone reductase-like Zn-dependent oxidoreductase